MIYNIDCFKVVGWTGDNAGPHYKVKCLSGFTDNPGFDSTRLVRTSAILSYKDGIVTTVSGSQYRLGTPDPEWLEAGYSVDQFFGQESC